MCQSRLGNFIKLQPHTKNYRQLRKLREGEIVFSREDHTNWLSNIENIQTSNIQIEHVMFRNICVYINKNTCRNNEWKRGVGVETEQEGVNRGF